MICSSCNKAALCSQFQVSNMVLFILKNDVSHIVKHFQYGVIFLHGMAVTENILLSEFVNGLCSYCFATRAEVTLYCCSAEKLIFLD